VAVAVDWLLPSQAVSKDARVPAASARAMARKWDGAESIAMKSPQSLAAAWTGSINHLRY
jgi:hypothetical protein